MGVRVFRCYMRLQWVSLLFAISPLVSFLFYIIQIPKQNHNKNKNPKNNNNQHTIAPRHMIPTEFLFSDFFLANRALLIEFSTIPALGWSSKSECSISIHFSWCSKLSEWLSEGSCSFNPPWMLFGYPQGVSSKKRLLTCFLFQTMQLCTCFVLKCMVSIMIRYQ